jgi:hypothetical protein
MTPIKKFSFDPTAVQAGMVVLPKDDYEFVLGEPKVFYRVKEDGNESYGITVPLLVVSEGEFKGKRIFPQFYLHTEAAWPMLKGFQLAALGFNVNQESQFNAQYKAENGEWDIDFENKTLGDFWRKLTGQRISATAEVKPNTVTGTDQNQFRWRPV